MKAAEERMSDLPAQVPAPRSLRHWGAPAALAAALQAGYPTSARGDDLHAPTISVHGFGTFGAVRSDQDEADVVSDTFLQPNGAGHTSRWHSGVDSKIGGQVEAAFSNEFSAVLQIVSKHRYDNSWTPEVEWANVKYQFTPGLSVRVGRTVAPTFMQSDTALVGYANPWVRPPRRCTAWSPSRTWTVSTLPGTLTPGLP